MPNEHTIEKLALMQRVADLEHDLMFARNMLMWTATATRVTTSHEGDTFTLKAYIDAQTIIDTDHLADSGKNLAVNVTRDTDPITKDIKLTVTMKPE